jgi:hypothetical protein
MFMQAVPRTFVPVPGGWGRLGVLNASGPDLRGEIGAIDRSLRTAGKEGRAARAANLARNGPHGFDSEPPTAISHSGFPPLGF